MENKKAVKRSIRIPEGLYREIERRAILRGKTINQEILEDMRNNV